MLSNLSDRNLWIIGIVLCAIAAWCTVGYYHPDEHHQILEFANFKHGNIAASELPWEFPARIRPGLQPFLAYLMIGGSKTLGIDNPFVQAFLMRVLVGAAALFVYWQWIKWLSQKLENPSAVRWLRNGLLFFWLMPFLTVRFTSENTAAICFFGGLLILLQIIDNQKHTFHWKAVAAGLLLGLSFFFRYQIAFAGIGLGAWLVFQNRLQWPVWAALSLGVAGSFCIGLATDYWLYNEWVFAPYNYFFSNIVEGKAAGFGVEPFWWYFTEIPMAFIPPLSIILAVFFSIGLWRNPKHPFTWCVIPFVLAHSMVGHKEIRFLFPMVLPFFYLAVMGWQYFQAKYTLKKWMISTFSVLLWINMLVLLFRICTPAQFRVSFARFFWEWYDEHPESTIYFVQNAPQKTLPICLPFYKKTAQKHLPWYTDPAYTNDTTLLQEDDLMLFMETLTPKPTAPPGFSLERAYTYYPDWVLLNNTNQWQNRTQIWAVYRLEVN
jgi:phosphatidylinositol glycan class B